MNPEELMKEGNEVLEPVLGVAGFAVESTTFGQGSGGSFGVCRWERGSQWVELHVRFALGIVRYGWGEEVFDHSHVVSALGVTALYPGFSDDPVDSFRHLAADLAGPLAPVLSLASDGVLAVARAWTSPGRQLQ